MPFFLEDYLRFNQGNECPENYHIWSALALVSAIVSRKVCIDFDAQRVYPNLYICLVGRPGTRKSTAKDIARDILEEEFPTIPRAAAITTAEGILKFMGTDACLRAYEESPGVNVEYRPIMLFVNELKNFLKVNPQGMLDFLTDIYDRKFFDTFFKGAGADVIVNPYVVLLACETAKWMREKMKLDIISGGFARRLIPIYETKKRCSIPRPFLSEPMRQARARVIGTLHRIHDIVGTFTWEPTAIEFFDKWYRSLKEPEDTAMEDYYSSKHTQLQKVAMLLTLTDHGDLLLRKETLERALALLDVIEPNMQALYEGSGLNIFADATAEMLRLIEVNGGMIPEKEFFRVTRRNMDYRQAQMTLMQLEKAEEIVRMSRDIKGVRRIYIVLKTHADKLIATSKSSPLDASPAGGSAEPRPSSSQDSTASSGQSSLPQ